MFHKDIQQSNDAKSAEMLPFNHATTIVAHMIHFSSAKPELQISLYHFNAVIFTPSEKLIIKIINFLIKFLDLWDKC